MILPDDFDFELPDDELVARLVASGEYDQAEAECTVRLLRSDLPVPLE